jgi:hypothetical protein
MTRGQKAAIAAVALLLAVFVAGVLYTSYQPRAPLAVSLEGAVIRSDFDPHARTPIAFAVITASSGGVSGQFKADASGFFRLKLEPKVDTSIITLRFQSAEYRPLAVDVPADTGVYIAQMKPITELEKIEESNTPLTLISNVRVRYSMKTRTTVDMGVLARTFQVFATAGAPCRDRAPCSPDRKWKAESGSESYNAEKSNEFREARVTCLAGPCPFTSVKSELTKDGQILKVSALSWFGTATFLVEAQVTHTMISDLVRQSYPFIFGDSMSFTLPAEGEGPSVEADVAKDDIVFPLGPEVLLPWAQCTVRVDADQSKLYRCTVEPGYHFVE